MRSSWLCCFSFRDAEPLLKTSPRHAPLSRRCCGAPLRKRPRCKCLTQRPAPIRRSLARRRLRLIDLRSRCGRKSLLTRCPLAPQFQRSGGANRCSPKILHSTARLLGKTAARLPRQRSNGETGRPQCLGSDSFRRQASIPARASGVRANRRRSYDRLHRCIIPAILALRLHTDMRRPTPMHGGRHDP
jgi:hypothetical protein